MATQISPLPIQHFVDNNGNSLAGGRLYTYAAGTTTPVATYTDSTGGTPNTNPVIMNARGEANVWLTFAQSYKFVLKDASDVTIWSVDNITTQSTTDAFNYTIPQTGGVARTLTAKLTDIPSVKDFGAVGDGVTDDYSKFVNHIAAYPNGPMLVPAGTYVLGTSLSIPFPVTFLDGAVLAPKTGAVISISGSPVADEQKIFSVAGGGSFSLSGAAVAVKASWFGMAAPNTAAVNTTAFNAMIAAMPSSNGCHIMWPPGVINVNNCSHSLSGVMQEGHHAGTWVVNNTTNAFALESLGAGNFNNGFKNFRIGQASGVTPVNGNGGIHIQSQQFKLSDCECFRFPAAPYDGVFIDGSIAGWMQTVSCSNLANHGFHFGGGCGDLMVSGLYSVANAGMGFYFNGSSGIYMSNSSAYGNFSAYFFDNTGHVNGSGTINEFCYFTNCIGDTSVSQNWNFQNLAESAFTACWGSTQISTASNTLASGFNVTGTSCYRITFASCVALSNNGNGFVIDQGAKEIQLIGCITRGNGRGIPSGGTLGSGIQLGIGGAVFSITVTACRNALNAINGIFIPGNASDYLIVSNNNNQGNTGTGLVNSASGTHNAIGTGANV